jgi:cytochrome P450
VFTFGSGPTSCVGERMMWSVLKFVAPILVKNFVWENRETFPPEIKYLPVARPKKLEPIIFRKRF